MTGQYPEGTVNAEAGFDLLTLIRETQLAHAAELKVIKGQLTDLPGMNHRLATTRLDLRSDIEGLRDQAAELPGIRAQLEDQARDLAEIKNLLVRLVGTTRPPADSAANVDFDDADGPRKGTDHEQHRQPGAWHRPGAAASR
jgi:hypothetical protein